MTIGTIQAMTITTRAMDQVRDTTSSSMTTGATKIINTITNRTTTSKTATTSNSNTTTNISSHTIKITILMIRRTTVQNNTIKAWVILLMARTIAVLVVGDSLIIKVIMIIEVNGAKINNSTVEVRKIRINNSTTEVRQIKTSNSTIEVLRIRTSMKREILASWEVLWANSTQTNSLAGEAWNNPLHKATMPQVRDSQARGSIRDQHFAINRIRITIRTLIRGNHIVGLEGQVASQGWVVLR